MTSKRLHNLSNNQSYITNNTRTKHEIVTKIIKSSKALRQQRKMIVRKRGKHAIRQWKNWPWIRSISIWLIHFPFHPHDYG